ncbi:gliding motility lipoprotein GldD [Winogradskyella sp. 3972H.M.0a.05]|uniref:gliding motility lipoprotein GldD n=1 Tax=Winogradskyella sp. 3972H.M.0a.05 TaxID=2950277 RepID=UPI003397BBDC
MRKLIFPLLAASVLSCADDPKPKPSAMLRLEYPNAEYQKTKMDIPFSFGKNKLAKSIKNIKFDRDNGSFGIDVEYPALKGTIYLTYKKVSEDNLIKLITDAQNLTQKHTIKADEISEQPFINPEKRVFGMFYEVGGNAASQSQFYATDSINHFVSGSLYFYAKPNYDSIYPAAVYLKNDIKHIMETLEWK